MKKKVLKAFCSSESCAGHRNMVVVKEAHKDDIFCFKCGSALFWIDTEVSRTNKKYMRKHKFEGNRTNLSCEERAYYAKW